MGGHLLRLYPSLQVARIKRITTSFPQSQRRYSLLNKENQSLSKPEGSQETVEELEKEIKEIEDFDKAKSKQGFSSQTVEKFQDGLEEATIGEAKDDKVKEKMIEPPGVGNFHKTGDNDDKGVLEG